MNESVNPPMEKTTPKIVSLKKRLHNKIVQGFHYPYVPLRSIDAELHVSAEKILDKAKKLVMDFDPSNPKGITPEYIAGYERACEDAQKELVEPEDHCSERSSCDETDLSGKRCIDYEFCVEEPKEDEQK